MMMIGVVFLRVSQSDEIYCNRVVLAVKSVGNVYRQKSSYQIDTQFDIYDDSGWDPISGFLLSPWTMWNGILPVVFHWWGR